MILKREIPSFFGSHNIKNIRWIMPQGIALILLRRITVTCVGQLLLYRLIYWFLGGRLPVYWQFWGCSMRFKLTGASNESLIFCLWNWLTEYRSKWTKYIFTNKSWTWMYLKIPTEQGVSSVGSSEPTDFWKVWNGTHGCWGNKKGLKM